MSQLFFWEPNGFKHFYMGKKNCTKFFWNKMLLITFPWLKSFVQLIFWKTDSFNYLSLLKNNCPYYFFWKPNAFKYFSMGKKNCAIFFYNKMHLISFPSIALTWSMETHQNWQNIYTSIIAIFVFIFILKSFLNFTLTNITFTSFFQ